MSARPAKLTVINAAGRCFPWYRIFVDGFRRTGYEPADMHTRASYRKPQDRPMSEGRRTRAFVSAQMVADRAGVSRSAVSRTFTQGASVSDETRRKVLEAAESLGYHVNHLARGLIREQSDIVCIIVADMATPYQSRMLDLITRRLQEIEKVAMVINTAGAGDDGAGALRQTLNYRADATIILSGTPAASLIGTCLANGQKVILINRDDPIRGPENIMTDNETGAREAFNLLNRAGCRKMAVVSSLAGTASLVSRETAFRRAAHEAGLEVEVVRTGPTAYRTGIEAARLVFGCKNPPDAAFCVTDLLACGFMDAARHEFRRRIPEDLCVVGFDDIEQAAWESYELTTFRQPIEAVVDHIGALLASRGEKRGAPRHATIPPLPMWRKTVRPGAA